MPISSLATATNPSSVATAATNAAAPSLGRCWFTAPAPGSIIVVVVLLVAQEAGGSIDDDRAQLAAHRAGGAQVLAFTRNHHACPAFRLQLAAHLLVAHGVVPRDEHARRALLGLRHHFDHTGRGDERGGADDRNDPLVHLLCSCRSIVCRSELIIARLRQD